MRYKVGFGFDVHRLEVNHPFWLGGILIPSEKGAAGHSDADVIIHAISDALLGASGLEDIGHHFPDTDIKWKGADSKKLLKIIISLLKKKNFKIGNVDVTLCLEKPKIASYVPEIKKTLASILELDFEEISIKATTNEKMGFIGRQEGVSAYAVALIYKE